MSNSTIKKTTNPKANIKVQDLEPASDPKGDETLAADESTDEKKPGRTTFANITLKRG